MLSTQDLLIMAIPMGGGIGLGIILKNVIDYAQHKIVGIILLLFGIGLGVYGRTAARSYGDEWGFWELVIGVALFIAGGTLLFSKLSAKALSKE